MVPPHSLAEDDEGALEEEWGFRVEMCYDADEAPAIEALCNNCRGAGHFARFCPSAKKYRSYAYVGELCTSAARRADARASEKGSATGGRRPPPREQRPPFKNGMPKRFQKSHPFRRFQPGKSVARWAGDGDDDDSSGAPGDTDTAGDNTNLAIARAQPSEVERARSAEEGRDDQPEADTSSARAVLSRTMPPGLCLPTTVSVQRDSDYFDSAPKVEKARGAAASSPSPEIVSQQVLVTGEAPIANVSQPVLRDTKGSQVRFVCGAAASAMLVALAACTTGVIEYSAALVSTAERAAAAVGAGVAALLMLLCIVQVARGDIVPTEGSTCVGYESVAPRTDHTGYDSVEQTNVMGDRPWLVETAYESAEHGLDDCVAIPDEVSFCDDSGCTTVCVSEYDAWMLSEITDDSPSVGLEVASDSDPLRVMLIGKINSKVTGIRLVCTSYELTKEGKLIPGESAPEISRVLVVKGMR